MRMRRRQRRLKCTPLRARHGYLFVDVPVQAVVLQNEPVLLPFMRKVTFGVPLAPQPAFAVASAKRLAGNAAAAQVG